jgi:hypothetical protein
MNRKDTKTAMVGFSHLGVLGVLAVKFMEDSMGRTVPTFTMVIQAEMETWSKFRRGLRKEDQDALDELFRAARMQLASSAYAARPIPFESIVMSMLIMQQRMIRELRRNLLVGKAVNRQDAENAKEE